MSTNFLLTWLGGTLLPLGALWLLHRLALRGERCFEFNRALLLLAPLLAATLPLLPLPALPAWLAGGGAPGAALPPVLLPTLAASAPAAASGPDWSWLAWAYAGGVELLLGRLAWQGWQLRRATRHLRREARPGYWLAYTGGRLPTSSFGRTIFWDETAGLMPAEAASVLAHELAHVRQGHSADVLWLEIWRAVLWPNPFAHLLLPALRLTHELLADQAAAHHPTPLAPAEAAAPYSALLARLAARGAVGTRYAALLQPFTFSFTLTRLAMLQNQIPVRRWKQWLVLPVLGGVFLVACQQREVVPTAASESKAEMQASVRRMLESKLAPLEQQRRAGQPFSEQQQKAYDYLEKQIQLNDELATPPPPTLSTVPDAGLEEAASGRVYTYVDQMPQLPGKSGIAPIVQQIQDNFRYPAGPRQNGRIFASFTVRADGSVGDTRIVKGLAPAFDAAVLAAIEQLPRFVPGRQDGKAVAVSFTVPITIKN